MRVLVAVIVAGIIAGACAPAGSGLPEVRVVLTDFAFAPKAVEIPAGRKVEFKLTNSGRVEHDITAEGIGFHVHVMSGERLALEAGPFEPGEYDIFCSVVGHREAGMVGKLVVRP
ncbi:MAG TPA: cupredoxin domain-containing protein [Candidatus Limnocylindria bacterium]|nr:cupredoxin domain-containing protein [Candidatus Limnocylindria bacterium]